MTAVPVPRGFGKLRLWLADQKSKRRRMRERPAAWVLDDIAELLHDYEIRNPIMSREQRGVCAGCGEDGFIHRVSELCDICHPMD